MGAANTHRPGDLPDKPPAGHHSGWDSRQAKGRPARHTSAARGASGKEPGKPLNYLLSFLITRLS